MADEIRVTTPHLLFLAMTGFTALLCMWAAVSALTGSREMRLLHRVWALTTAVLLPPVTLAAALAMKLDVSWLVAVAALLPLLVLTAAWCNVTTVQEQSFAIKLLHVPVFLFNALLAGIYAVRATQDQFGFDLGTWGTAVTGGHALLQDIVGQAAADQNPIWFYLPFLLPLSSMYRWPHKLALFFSSAASTALLGLLVTLMPFAYTRAQSYRADPQDEISSLPAGMSIGVFMPWAKTLSEEAVTAWREDLHALHARSVTIEIEPAAIADEHLVAQILAEIGQARDRGVEIVAIARPGIDVLTGGLRELTLGMAQLQWLAAEKLSPDLFVLYAGPFGRLSELTVKVGTIEEWMQAIARSAGEVRQANPDVKVAVAIENPAPHAEELFRRLRAADSPVDVVGLSIAPLGGPASEAYAKLATLSAWMKRNPGPRPVRILETGASPFATGGELGQWHFLHSVLTFAIEHGVKAVSIDALADPDSMLGLVARDGRRRLAFRRLQELLGQGQATPAK